jgi:hypothetical protein
MAEGKKFSSSWHESSVAVKPTHPQLMLYRSVFASGIRDYVMPDSGDRRSWAEAWVSDTEATEHDPGTFPWYCRRLNLNPEKTRARLFSPEQVSELRRIIAEGIRVEENIIGFLRGKGIVHRPEPPPPKLAARTTKMKMFLSDKDKDS